MIEGHHAIVALLRERQDTARSGLVIPPPCTTLLGSEFVSYDEANRTLVTRLPAVGQFSNPAGVMQGGLIAAAMDNTMGPLCYLVAPPSVTLSMSLVFIRPVMDPPAPVEVTARIIDRTRRQLHVEAQLALPDHRIAARATALFGVVV